MKQSASRQHWNACIQWRLLPKEALDSILAQTFKDFELPDNGSTDRTQEICRAYATQDNAFVITVMNKILELAGIKVV